MPLAIICSANNTTRHVLNEGGEAQTHAGRQPPPLKQSSATVGNTNGKTYGVPACSFQKGPNCLRGEGVLGARQAGRRTSVEAGRQTPLPPPDTPLSTHRPEHGAPRRLPERNVVRSHRSFISPCKLPPAQPQPVLFSPEHLACLGVFTIDTTPLRTKNRRLLPVRVQPLLAPIFSPNVRWLCRPLSLSLSLPPHLPLSLALSIPLSATSPPPSPPPHRPLPLSLPLLYPSYTIPFPILYPPYTISSLYCKVPLKSLLLFFTAICTFFYCFF